jgi:hypothetical protein
MVILWWLLFIWLSEAELEERGSRDHGNGDSLVPQDGSLVSHEVASAWPGPVEPYVEDLVREQHYFSGIGTESRSSPSFSIEAPLPVPITSALRLLSPFIPNSGSLDVQHRLISTTSSARPTIHPKRPPHEGTTPTICKTVVGDVMWPHYDIWKSYMPNVTEMWIRGNEAHPNYFLAAKNIADVEAAVTFASKYNIRLSIVSSGLDYSGR